MSLTESEVKKNKSRPLASTILGKPNLEWKQQTNTITPMESEKKKGPNIVIEQFLNPPRRSQMTPASTSKLRTQSTDRSRGDISVSATPMQPRSHSTIGRTSPSPNALTSRRDLEQNTSRRQSASFSPRQTAVNPNPEDTVTPPYYWTMPQWFRDAHPLARGGGLLAPKRRNAPLRSLDYPINSQRSGEGMSQSRTSRRSSPGRTFKRHQQRPVQYGETRSIASEGAIRTVSGGSSSSSKATRAQSQNPRWYSKMPEEWQQSHPLATGGGILSPGRSYAPAYGHYTGPSIEAMMIDRDVRQLSRYREGDE